MIGSKAFVLPVYPLTSRITQGKCVNGKSTLYLHALNEYLPKSTLRRNRLCGIHCYENIHFPKDRKTLMQAKYRFIFEELLFLQTGLLAIKRRMASVENGVSFSEEVTTDDFIASLPYALTAAQQRVLNEIILDMESGKVMNRLVQGDVGSGKTILAAAAMYKAVKCGFQAVMMAPTELLAKQHFNDLKLIFDKHQIKLGFLSAIFL